MLQYVDEDYFRIVILDIARRCWNELPFGLCGKQIYVRLDGLGDAMKRQLMHAGSVNVTQLIHLLQQLEVPVNPSEPVHVELLVRLHNKAVLVHHANQSTLSTLFRGEH